MEKILSTTRQPGMSIGVLHQGQVVFKRNFGVLDIESEQKPDSDTLYCVASLSKAFIAASLGLLVRDGKSSWDTAIDSMIPAIKHWERPSLFSDLELRDICSHRTGLLSLDESTQGLDSPILIPKTDLVQVCNALPVKYDLRTAFLYNNAMFALAGGIIEHLSNYSNWGHFLHDRIFEPRDMSRSTAFRAVHEMDSNIATPYMILTDGHASKTAPTELSADSMNGGSGGIRSSVNDLLKWCSCLLKSFHGSDKESLVRHDYPVFNRATIANPQCAEEGNYCAGLCYHRTPGKLGLISPNRMWESPVLGSASPSLLVYGHQGDVPGYTCNIYIIPESDSAIVILSNGTGLSDATDWIAQDLLQAMYGLRPAIDFVDMAAKGAMKYLSHYTKDFKIPLEGNQIHGTTLPPVDDFVGSYVMDHLDIVCLDVSISTKDVSRLMMVVNEQLDQAWETWHYNFDT